MNGSHALAGTLSTGFGAKRKGRLFKELRKNRALFFMALPAVAYYLIFSYLPMAGTIIAFKSYNYAGGIFGSPWNGLANFKFLFFGGKIFQVALNTLAYNATFILVNQFLEILFAVLLVEIGSKYFRKTIQSIMILPYFVSWVIVGAFVASLFNYEFGALNSLRKAIGLAPYDAMADIGVWKYILVSVEAWKWVGYGTVIYLAAIMGIDTELYEAAIIDGAGKLRKIASITLPMILPQIVILVLLSIGRIFRGDFQMFYQVTGNNPMLYDSTDVIDTFVVRSLLQLQDVGMAAAAGFFQSLMCLVILLSVNGLVRKFQKDYALF